MEYIGTVVETRAVRVTCVVEADSVEEAKQKMEAGETIEEYGEDYEVIGRAAKDETIHEASDRGLPGEDMDGDHAPGLASAGMGTDEDYGCFDAGDDYLGNLA